MGKITHGHTVGVEHDRSMMPATYICWQQMKGRCTNPRNKFFANYGGRGIEVCRRWLRSYQAFLDDMGEKPPGMSIERINNHGHYEPGNCRWATMAEQAVNKRSTVLLTWRGKTMCMGHWADRYGMERSMLRNRLRRGLSLKEALTTPIDTEQSRRSRCRVR